MGKSPSYFIVESSALPEIFLKVAEAKRLGLEKKRTDRDALSALLRASIRSSVATQKKAVLDQLICLTEQLGGTTEAEGDYPGWEYMPQSPLRERMVEVYQEQYGKEPTIKAMHAGVECGLFSEKLPGLDCVSFGPDLSDIHTPRERMHIASVQRTWELVKEVLKRSK